MCCLPETDEKLLRILLSLPEKKLLNILATYLAEHDYKPLVTKNYILAQGSLPVMLIAHLDTVYETPPYEIYYDKTANVIWSPQGLGADDRAGVFAIIQLLQMGWRPHILFTTGEEALGIGIKKLLKKFYKAPFDIKYLIELDRQGHNDCVFYDCPNEDFQKYIESFGFKTQKGIFTDISLLAPFWNIAGVNLSVGYYDEHSYVERLFIDPLIDTIEKVSNMLNEVYQDDVNYYKYQKEENYY